MSEPVKTLCFVAAGVVALLAAYFIDAETQAVNVEQFVGQTLNNDFEVDAPKRLKIIKFDRQTAQTRQFEVAAVDGVWSIPSKQGYPADATRQMAAAANCLIDRKILRIAAESADAHEELGVVDPLSASLDSGSAGVGTHVILTDADDNELVNMIIGKKVKDAEGQRYIRKNNQNVVYIVELDPASLSTDFNDWIEDDLLKLSPFDITKVFINDYSADLGMVLTPQGIQRRVSWDRRGEYTLTYDNADAKWNLASIKKFDQTTEQMVDDALAEDEEVNQDALGKLRTGLDDLLLVDVARKPDGLSADLKAGESFLNNREAAQDLIDKGFSPVPLVEGAEPEILSSEGEAICTLRDGVEYVLRFGKLQVQTESAEDGEEPAADGEAAVAEGAEKTGAKDEDGKDLRRYLFVMARFNEDSIEKPKLKELPALPEAAEEQPAEKPADAAPADEAPAEDQPAAGAEGEADAATTPPAGGDEPAAAAPDDQTDDEAPSDAEAPADEVPAAEASDPAAADAPQEPTELEKVEAERKAIEEENKRLQDQYDETVKTGKERVAELNDRFGDWYYVISNDVFKQIHLGRDQVIKKKEKPAADAATPAGGADEPLPGLPNLPLGGATPEAGEPAE